MKIELFAPGNPVPVNTWKTKGGWSKVEEANFEHALNNSGDEIGVWECRATNTGLVPAQVTFGVSYTFSNKPLLAGLLPIVLLDHTYQEILNVLTPSAKIDGDTVTVTFDPELKRFFGNTQPAILAPASFPLKFNLQGTGSLACLELEACSGQQLLAAMRDQYQGVHSAYAQALAHAQRLNASQSARLNRF